MLLFANQREKTANELRDESQASEEQRSPAELKKVVQTLMKSSPGDFQKKFNEAFELTKIGDYMDDGVEVNERTQSTKRSNIAIAKDPTMNENNLNDIFNRKAKVNKALVVRESKHPIGVSSLKQSVYEYGKKEEHDFGRFTRGASDYRIAYAGERLIDPTEPIDKPITGTVSLEAAKQQRSLQNINPEMTEEERESWAEELEAKERMEEERKANLVQRDYEANKR